MATQNSVNLGLSGSTGTGNFAGSTSPTFVTPLLGTPTSGTLTNCSGLPISTGVSGLGTGIATFLATPSSANLLTAMTTSTGSGNLTFATSPTLVTPLLGTPTSGTLTNCTGLPISTGVSGLGSGVATWLATPTSANLLSAVVTTSTGSGSLVFATSPTLVTPALGTPSSVNLSNATSLASAALPAGTLFNTQQGQFTSTTSILSSTPVDSGVTVSITPTSSSNKVLVRAVICFAVATTDNGFLQLVRGSTAIGLGAVTGSRTSVGAQSNVSTASMLQSVTLEWLDSPATTSATTYKVQAWTTGGAQSYINRSVTDTNSAAFCRTASVITVHEVHA